MRDFERKKNALYIVYNHPRFYFYEIALCVKIPFV